MEKCCSIAMRWRVTVWTVAQENFYWTPKASATGRVLKDFTVRAEFLARGTRPHAQGQTAGRGQAREACRHVRQQSAAVHRGTGRIAGDHRHVPGRADHHHQLQRPRQGCTRQTQAQEGRMTNLACVGRGRAPQALLRSSSVCEPLLDFVHQRMREARLAQLCEVRKNDVLP